MAALVAALAVGCSPNAGGKSGGAGASHTIVLTLANQISGGPPEQLMLFAKQVEARSSGAIRIDFHDNWRAGDPHQEVDTIGDVKTGKVDLAWVGARAWDWVGVKSFDALVAPFLVDRHELERRVFAAGIPQRMLAGITRTGVVGIGVLPGPLRTLVGVHVPLVAPSDFRGKSIGVQGVVASDTFATLGARPRQVVAQPP
jgi:TRAP-type C4-dicarboxylate transport system substrate-binding protein